MQLYKASCWLHHHNMRRLRSLMTFFIRFIWNCDIRPGAYIGDGSVFMHNGLGVVIGDRAKIGNNVVIFQNVTVGSNGRIMGMPVIEDGVCLGAGAKILGPIVIGKNSVIGANSVVIADVPENSLVVGVPGRVIKSDINRKDYM